MTMREAWRNLGLAFRDLGDALLMAFLEGVGNLLGAEVVPEDRAEEIRRLVNDDAE